MPVTDNADLKQSQQVSQCEYEQIKWQLLG